MRVISILLLTVALATSSGCFGKDDEPPAITTPTTPTGGTSTTPTGATPTGATPTNPTAPTTPMAPAPRELCAATENFQDNQPPVPPTGPAVVPAACGAVPAGYTKITITGNFSTPAPAPLTVANAIAVKVLDSTGAAIITCPGPQAGAATETPCTGESAASVGEYTLQYEGEGNVQFTGSVMIS